MTLHLTAPEEIVAPCCGNCRNFVREDMAGRRVPGTVAPDGGCGLRNPGNREGLTRWCRETDWCEEHQPAAAAQAEGGAS